jgi:hypothetical protein
MVQMLNWIVFVVVELSPRLQKVGAPTVVSAAGAADSVHVLSKLVSSPSSWVHPAWLVNSSL